MPTTEEHWDPEEWQSHSHGLLSDRHGPTNVMKVPDRHKGDMGLDYYCLSGAVVYQCYAVEMPCDVADRASKQKAKITVDIKKFCASTPELRTLFGDTKIARWILLVPLHDSADVNQHASTKTKEVRGRALSYATDDFEVLVQDQSTFPQWSTGQRALQRRSFSIVASEPTEQEVTAWAEASNELVANLALKLAKRVSGKGLSVSDGVSDAISWLLSRDNSLEQLRLAAPDVHDRLIAIIARHTKRLQLAGPPVDGSAHTILREELERLTDAIKKGMPNVTDDSAEQIALGTVADWLLRCPLDFPPYATA